MMSLMRFGLTTYRHTQRAPLCLVLYAVGVTMLVVAWMVRANPWMPYLFLPLGLLMLLFAVSFHHLTVADEGPLLLIQFGPLPLFQRRVYYEDIESVEVGRTTVLEGWGIHMSPRGGWVWNLWGFDCVVLKLRKGTLRIGTDDAENLASFINGRIEDTPQ